MRSKTWQKKPNVLGIMQNNISIYRSGGERAVAPRVRPCHGTEQGAILVASMPEFIQIGFDTGDCFGMHGQEPDLFSFAVNPEVFDATAILVITNSERAKFRASQSMI
jgi:hypothetical protein